MKKSRNKAFSLIELSIVILIIGILIAGVVQGSKLYQKSQLMIARNLTTNSPVNGIRNLALWYETSLDSSFKSTEAVDQAAISAWYDNSPQSPAKNNATQSTTSAKPVYIENAFPNNIPGVRLDGSNDHFSYDGTVLVSTDYTIFIVEQRRWAGFGLILGGNSGNASQNLQVGYRSNTYFTIDHQSTPQLNYAVSGYSAPTPAMHTAMFSTTFGRKYWSNGGINPDATHSISTSLAAYPGAYIGRYASSTYYKGDIAEIIEFNRALTTEERQAIESYLSQKYSIAITP